MIIERSINHKDENNQYKVSEVINEEYEEDQHIQNDFLKEQKVFLE